MIQILNKMKTIIAAAAVAATALAAEKEVSIREYSSIDLGIVAVQWNVHADIGYGWEAPLYNDFDALVWRPRVFLYGGGLQWVSIGNDWFTWTFFADTNVAKAVVDPYFEMSMKEYTDICTSGQWVLDMFRAAVYYQVSYATCKWGVLGILLDRDTNCGGYSNYISEPLIDIRFYDNENDGQTGQIWNNSCSHDIPLYGV